MMGEVFIWGVYCNDIALQPTLVNTNIKKQQFRDLTISHNLFGAID